MSMARLVATRATCIRRAVGCVLVNERRHVLATGYNGVASGLPHCNHEEVRRFHPAPGAPVEVTTHYDHACAGAFAPSGQSLDRCEAIHAEQNALLQCQDVFTIHTAYVTASPCVTCVKLLMNTSCRRIVFDEEYPHGEARTLWERAGREWVQDRTGD